MPFIQKNVPPPNNILSFNLLDFSGGLNNRSHQLKDNESPDMCNFLFSDETLLRKRNGLKITSDFSGPTISNVHLSRIVFADFVSFSGSGELTPVTFNGEYMNFNNGAFTKQVYSDRSIFSSMIDGRYVYSDGMSLNFLADYGDLVANTYLRIVGTIPSGLVSLRLVSPPTNYTPLDTSHPNGVHVFDFGNKTCWYEPCENELVDPHKGANVVPDANLGVYHEDRVYVTRSHHQADTGIYVSDIGNPFYFPVYLGLNTQPDGDINIGMAVFQNDIVVAKYNSIYVISGNTNRTDTESDVFRINKLNTHVGFISPYSHVVAHNYLFFLGSDLNFYVLTTTQTVNDNIVTQVISPNLDLTANPINATIGSPFLSAGRQTLHSATFYFYDDHLWVAIGDYKVLVYSYRKRAWTFLNNVPASFFAFNPSNRKFYMYGDMMAQTIIDSGLNVGGKIYEFDSNSYIDFGVQPYKAYWKSKNFAMGYESTYKQFREFYLVTHVDDNLPTTVKVRFEVDYADVGSVVVSKSQMARWGISTWGSRFITRNINASLPFVIGRRGRYIRFILENGYTSSGEASYSSLPNIIRGVPLETTYYVKGAPGGDAYYVFGEDRTWHRLLPEDLNQPFKFYEINGDYEFRGKR